MNYIGHYLKKITKNTKFILQNTKNKYIFKLKLVRYNKKGGKIQVKKFKAYCVEHDIKQKEIAELLDINISNVNNKLNGKEPFTLAQVKLLCEHFQISADEYFI